MSASNANATPNRKSTDVIWDVESVIRTSAEPIKVSDLPIPTNMDRGVTDMIQAPLRRLVPELKDTKATGPSRLKALYAPHFLRLEQGLKALEKPENIVQAGEGVVARSVTEGLVPALDVVDVEAEGKLVFGSELAPLRRLVPELKDTKATGPSRLKALYAPHFLRLEQALKALEKPENIVQAGEGVVARSVTEDLVPALDVVDVEAEGKLVFGSELGN